VFDATVIEKVKKEGAIIIGKTAQDEFGFGSFSTNVGIGFDVPLNPFDKGRACGGSSGGSGGISQKASFPHISLGESTGGSIVAPASFCGVYGLCPTYGRVSRYGLIDYANSLDKIGPMGKDMHDIALCQEIITGYDEKDSTSINRPSEAYQADGNVKGMKLAVVRKALAKELQKSIKGSLGLCQKPGEQRRKILRDNPANEHEYGIATYYIIAASEASTNLASTAG